LTGYLFARCALTRLREATRATVRPAVIPAACALLLILGWSAAGSPAQNIRDGDASSGGPWSLGALRLRLSPRYYSGDRRILVTAKPAAAAHVVPSPTPAHESDRLTRAAEAALDVAQVLADRAGAIAKAGSMSLEVPIEPEVSFLTLGSGRTWIVFAALVHVETSGRHVTTASVAAAVETDGSIVLLRTWAAAYGPATLNRLKVVRLSSTASAETAPARELMVTIEGVAERVSTERYVLSGKTLKRI